MKGLLIVIDTFVYSNDSELGGGVGTRARTEGRMTELR